MSPDISVVIPAHNEAGNLRPLHEELRTALAKVGRPYEILYINDGSTDGTAAEIASLEDATMIDLGGRFGQSVAFTRGFRAARGNIVISMDGDGQNDPADIPRLLARLESGKSDVVSGWRKDRKDPFSIRFVSACGRLLRRLLFNDSIRDAGCSLRAYRREALEGVELSGKMHSYLLLIIRSRGFSIEEIEVNHRPRSLGESKYSAKKALPGLRELLRLRATRIYNGPMKRSRTASFLVKRRIAKDAASADRLLIGFAGGCTLAALVITAYAMYGGSIARAHSSLPPDVVHDLQIYAQEQKQAVGK